MDQEPGNSKVSPDLTDLNQEPFNEYARQAIEVINGLDELDDNMKQCASWAINKAIEIIGKNFEGRDNPVENLDFHNSRHTMAVVIKTIKILRAMKEGGVTIESKHFHEAIIAVAFHDTVQNYEVKETEENGFKKKVRVRAVGENERASAEQARDFMERINREASIAVFFDKESINRVVKAIMSTVPQFDPQHNTVIQPNLDKSDPVSLALALADLGTTGMDGYEEFHEEGDALFREKNIDIAEALRNPSGIYYKEKEYFRQRMIAWSESQVSFAEGRKLRFESELEGLPDGAKEKLRQLFNKFDETITGAQAKALARKDEKKMSFEMLARDMGYQF